MKDNECYNIGNSTVNSSFEYNGLNISRFSGLDCDVANRVDFVTFSKCTEGEGGGEGEGSRRDYLVTGSSSMILLLLFVVFLILMFARCAYFPFSPLFSLLLRSFRSNW
jgi:hypothetical protein